MRIGIHPALKPEDGGIYQYTVTMLHALHRLSACEAVDDEFVVFAHRPGDVALTRLSHPCWSVQPFRPPWAAKSVPAANSRLDPDQPGVQPEMGAWLRECGVEWMLYPSPHRLSFESGIPFVMAVHDLQHRLHPEFPEVSADGEGERREYVFRNAARSATLLIADSQVGRDDILACYGSYGLSAGRVYILPYLPACSVDLGSARLEVPAVRGRYRLPDRYLLYPAQFWPHKNHLRLVQAIGLLRSEHQLNVSLVLTGSASGAIRERVLSDVRQAGRALGVQEMIIGLGYVDTLDLAALYAGATALVMPTFFGPTNIPVLEAWAMCCPVLTSDIRGIREQVGGAAVLVDPASVESIAEGIRRVWCEERLRCELVAAGQARLATYTSVDYDRALLAILEGAKEGLRCSTRTAAAVC